MPVQLPNAPALNLSNPSIEAGAGYAGAASHAYAAGLQFATALRDSALKQQQQQQAAAAKQAYDLAQQQAKFRQMGGTMVGGGQTTVPGTQSTTNPGGPTLPGLQVRPGATQSDDADAAKMRLPGVDPTTSLSQALQQGGQPGLPPSQTTPPALGSPQPAADDASHFQLDMKGNRWHIPTLEERATAKQRPQDDSNSFLPTGDLADRLSKAGVKPGVRLPLADALRNPPSTGAEHYITGQDAEGNEATFVVDPKTHKAVPVEFPEGYSPGKPAAEKPAKYTYEHFVDDAGKVTHIRHTDAEDDIPQILKGGKWVAAEGGEAVGPKRKDPDAVKGPKAATPTQINTINNRRRVGLARAEAAFKKAMAAASMGGYTDTEKAAQALEDLHQAKQSAQDAYEGELSEFGIPFEHVEYSENTRPAQNAPAAPAKAEQQQTPALAPQAQGSTPTSQAKGKLTDQNKAKVYIQRAGGDKERARALAKADGWEF